MEQRYMDLILAYLKVWGKYHNQKEHMTWLAATLYIGGAVALVFINDPPWHKLSWTGFVALLILLFATGVIGIFVVLWQFKNRGFASDIFTACVNVAACWAETAPSPENLKPEPLNVKYVAPIRIPAKLADEYRRIATSTGRPVAKYLTVSTMLIWAFAALARVLFTAP